MNKLLIYLFYISSVICFAQNENLVFELKYHPNSEYSSEYKKTTKLKIEKKVDKETLKYYDSVGIKRHNKGVKTISYNIITFTKEKDKNQSMPIEIFAHDYNYKSTLNKEKIDLNNNGKTIKINGNVDNKSNLTVNELLVDNKKSKIENEIIKSLENKEVGIEFPKKIEIGKSFSFEYTIYYGATLEEDNFYSSNCTVKLIKIKKGIAHFTISPEQTPEILNYKLAVNGILKFNIEGNFVSSISLKSELHIDEIIDDGILFEHNYSEKINIRTELKNTSW